MRRLLFPHLVVWVLVIAVLRITLVPAEVCPSVDAGTVRQALDRAVAWFERGLQGDGLYLYGYDRDADAVSTDYNLVRHAGVIMAMYQLAEAGQPETLELGDRGLAFITENLLEHDDWLAFAPPDTNASIGANALTIAGLVHRRLATGDTGYDPLMRGLARFLVAQQLADGSILGVWSPRTEQPLPGFFAKFGAGEAFWALALMDRLFPNEGWETPARNAGRYLATERDDAEGYGVAFPDHWAAYGLAELGPAALGEPELAYARLQVGYFATWTRLESQSSRGSLRRLLRGPTASGAGLGTIGEGLGSYWRLSRSDPRLAGLETGLAERLRCNAGRIVTRQADSGEAARYARPSLVDGAWFARGYSQMDDQQHVVSALLAALELLDEGATG